MPLSANINGTNEWTGTHIDVEFYDTVRVDGHVCANDAETVESFEQRDPRNSAIVRVEAELPDRLTRSAIVIAGDVLRRRERHPRPNVLVPIGGTSGWNRQSGALCGWCGMIRLTSILNLKMCIYWIGSRRCPQRYTARIVVARFVASVTDGGHILEELFDYL